MYESYRFVRWMRNKLGSVLDKRGHRRVDFGARNLALGKRRRAQHKVESNSHAKSHGSSGQNRHSGVHSERSMNMEAKPPLQQSTQDEQIRTALDQHWTASDATIMKRSTASISRKRCWNTHSQASERAVDPTYRTSAPVSPTKSGFLSDESLAAVSFGSPNSS